MSERCIKKFTKEDAYKRGYDCGLNGSNLTNSHFAIFSSSENTNEWERGKKDAEKIKRETTLWKLKQ